MLEMKVRSLKLDETTNMPVVVLEDAKQERSLTIWIGVFEAKAISFELEEVETPRPMTHDLIKNIVEGLKAKVNHIAISELRDNTFFAVISLTVNGNEVVIDSRPSDAIAFALRVKAPILVAEKVLEMVQAESPEAKPQPRGESIGQEDLKKWIEGLKPKDFG